MAKTVEALSDMPVSASDTESATTTPESPPQQAPLPAASHEEAPAGEAFSAEESAPIGGREELTAHVLSVVSERTGYPVEMLDVDLDVEADLGIDSIKRVEILGTVLKAHFADRQEIGQEAMEELTAHKTLRGIIDWITNNLSPRSE